MSTGLNAGLVGAWAGMRAPLPPAGGSVPGCPSGADYSCRPRRCSCCRCPRPRRRYCPSLRRCHSTVAPTAVRHQSTTAAITAPAAGSAAAAVIAGAPTCILASGSRLKVSRRAAAHLARAAFNRLEPEGEVLPAGLVGLRSSTRELDAPTLADTALCYLALGTPAWQVCYRRPEKSWAGRTRTLRANDVATDRLD